MPPTHMSSEQVGVSQYVSVTGKPPLDLHNPEAQAALVVSMTEADPVGDRPTGPVTHTRHARLDELKSRSRGRLPGSAPPPLQAAGASPPRSPLQVRSHRPRQCRSAASRSSSTGDARPRPRWSQVHPREGRVGTRRQASHRFRRGQRRQPEWRRGKMNASDKPPEEPLEGAKLWPRGALGLQGVARGE